MLVAHSVDQNKSLINQGNMKFYRVECFRRDNLDFFSVFQFLISELLIQ